MTRARDLEMLNALLDEHRGELQEFEQDAFDDMRAGLRRFQGTALTTKQREWVERAHGKLVVEYENLVSSGQAPRGREVVQHNHGPKAVCASSTCPAWSAAHRGLPTSFAPTPDMLPKRPPIRSRGGGGADDL